MAFARSLPHPLLHDSIARAEPLSPIYGYRRTYGKRVRQRRWPERLVALGDAVCAFNPVYGQGMTTSAMGAAPRALPARAASALQRRLRPAWRDATSGASTG